MRIFLVTVFLLLSYLLNAQPYPVQHDSTHVFYAEAGLGISSPLGTFKFNYSGENEGFAVNGINIQLSAKTYKNSFYGFKYSANAMINPVELSFHTTSDISSATPSDVGKWINVFYGMGPLFYYSSESAIFEFSLMGGFISSTRPKIIYRFYDSLGLLLNEYKLTGGYGLGIGFSPEISFTFKIGDKKSLKLFANYVYASTKVNYKIFGGNYDNYTGLDYLDSRSQKLKIESLNLGLSLVFLL